MDAVPGARPAALSRADRGGRTRLRPTVFGTVLALVVVLVAVARPAMADPSVAGLVWAGFFAALLLGVCWPLVAVRGVGVRIVAAPTDLVVDQLTSIEVELTGRASGLSVGCTGQQVTVLDVVAPSRLRVPVSITRRGEYSRMRITIGSDAPFGIAAATRSRVVTLPRPVLVGPASERTPLHVAELHGDIADASPRGAGTQGETVRSVRSYVYGDPAHLVHWPSTARTGDLVVRGLEPPARLGVAVVVDLGGGPRPHHPDGPAHADGPGHPDGPAHADGPADADDPVERAARRAAGAAEAALDAGAAVMLCTREAGREVVAEVGDLLAIRRRLARAVPGPPPAAPEGWPVLRIAAEAPAARAEGAAS